MLKNLKNVALLSVTAVLAASCGTQVEAPTASTSALLETQSLQSEANYVVSSTQALPANFRAVAARNGDTVIAANEAAGFASVRTRNPAAYRKYADIVVRDVTLQWIPNEKHQEISAEDVDANAAIQGTGTNPFASLLWGLDAVNAPEAWAAGVKGKGVRIAVLDSGIDRTHPDLVGNLNAGLSESFVPNEEYFVRPGVFFNHGTHVAGTIAASDNNVGVIGVAPEAEIVAVKVLSEYSGSGSFGGIIAGIMYAADIGSDVINMSLGATLQKRGFTDDNGTPDDPKDDFFVPGSAKDVAELTTALSRATTYAHRKGVTMIASEGNDAIDKDHSADVISVPADSAHVLSISATAPEGWAKTPTVNLNGLSSYSNYGASAVNFAAPGGDFDLPGNDVCTVGSVRQLCYAFDMVFSTVAGGRYSWSAGTSMAAPHASGIAALIIGQNGGQMNPAQVASEMAKRAQDFGKQGNDPAYGGGLVHSGF
ncbi:S8 family serine peptidase [Deinococcus sp. NW-56]|uniref:S8 family serine peptidase n=1 Tax=Deinococcus sp. NW-56 TaxID=2080419 RepID=UPI00131A41BE|nr:S8 family serine peptidase [Deinococcus sp. NW-56]